MTSRRTFAFTALALGAAAPFARSPFRSRSGTVDVEALAREVERGTDHVDAIELAAWIKDRKPKLRVFDLRTKEQFDEEHIPTAEHVPMDEIASARIAGDETVVLYGEGGAHAGQAWVFLRALGHERVVFLRTGAYEWVEQVLNPALPLDATDSEREAFAKASELSHYFGGTPRRDVPRSQLGTTLRELKRRGC
ncbi:MAG TPA: rhodanese-like domain-containing protein [Gemmatimonadaceae bacterium]|nr:rhodanese-like domain-containing protein [Gemmatimonadaceae bacterium]